MNVVRVPWEKLKLIDFLGIAEGFYGQYDDIRIDGDEKAVVIENPKQKLLEALKRAGHV